MIGTLTGIGFLVLCLQVAIGFPAIALSRLEAPTMRLQSATFRVALVWTALCALATVAALAQNWALLTTILWYSVLAIPLAALGVFGLATFAIRLSKPLWSPKLISDTDAKSPEAQLIQESMQVAADSLELTRLPRLAVHQARTTPAVTGAIRPLLLAPQFLSELKPEDRLLVMTHELAHLKKGHLYWCGLATALASLLLPGGLSKSLKKACKGLAEEEADQTLQILDFSTEQIRDVRQTIAGLVTITPKQLRTAQQTVAGNVTTGTGPVLFEYKFERIELSQVLDHFGSLPSIAILTLLSLSMSGPVLALGPMAHPNWYSSKIDEAFLTGKLAGHFTDSVGNYYRGRYDIVFSENGRLTRMRGDGSGKRVLIRKSFSEPDVSRDGSVIVAVGPQQGINELFVMNGDGKNWRKLTDTPGIDEREPKLSPDGRLIVYSAMPWDPEANNGHGGKGDYRYDESQIHIYDLSTGKDKNLSATLGPGIEVSFGHNGEYILYMVGDHLLRANIDGSGKRQLTFGRNGEPRPFQSDHYPCSNFDGSLISFNRTIELETKDWNHEVPEDAANRTFTTGVWFMRADGSNPKPATQPQCGKLEQSGARFSPFGTWIAYMETETIDDAPSQTIWESDLMTGERRPLFDREGTTWPSYTGLIR